ncbi:phasin family protein [Pseudoduganella aquatica]|uniref:TIGR01841 family phasin n=1 Tax=Pseudoduganella aquatica TaxID=2660641 RepID=A0A7X4H7T4_9BURK|nr:phasin family protein [Pseudoduganella aquatica]MYN06288.1 TIGR01841 family phasin [Pseudoduganella aquatica]
MFSFNQSVTPAAKHHMEAQVSLINDMSKSLFRTVQQYSDLNIQLAQTIAEEMSLTGQELLTTNRPAEVVNVTLSHAQPTADKLRAYQQHLSRIAANTHVALAKVAEEHVSETSRTAKELAEEVTRMATEETEKNVRTQQDAMRRMAATFDQFADGHHLQPDGHSNGRDREEQQRQQAEAQAAESRAAGAQVHQTSQPAGSKQPGARKEG